MQKMNIAVRTLLVIALAGLPVIPALAQEQSSRVIPNTVWVGADGKFEAEPDTAVVSFAISAQEKKLQDAMQRATEATDRVRQLLSSNGIEPSHAQIGRFATQPVYDYQNAKRPLIGYRVDSNISVKLKDFAKIGPISEGLANMEITDTSISYELENMDAAKIKAVNDALRKAHDMANSVAQASGRSLGELSYASVDTFEPQPVRPMMMKAQVAGAAAPAPTEGFSAEKITVTAHVNALYGLK